MQRTRSTSIARDHLSDATGGSRHDYGPGKNPGVESVEPLNTVDIRYKIKPGDPWRKGSILMRDDYENQTYDRLQLKDGEWPSGLSLAIERMHSPFYGLDIGDTVIVEVGDQEQTFPITGKIRHPFVPPPSMYDWAWFFGSAELDGFIRHSAGAVHSNQGGYPELHTGYMPGWSPQTSKSDWPGKASRSWQPSIRTRPNIGGGHLWMG